MLSVIVPTRNRRATLVHTVTRVLAQALPSAGFELIVVDNGSTDDTWSSLRELEARSERLHAVYEPKPGPAAARNAGAQVARGSVLMFLGDDTAPASNDLLTCHAALHDVRPDSRYAALGRVEWDRRFPVTPFMRWLERGPQFAFELLAAGPVDIAAYFYTSHVSLKRAAFEAADGFDERFPYAAVEDMEFGMRLGAIGTVLEYRPELVVLHSHPVTLAQWLRRMRLAGRSAALLEHVQPNRRNRTVSVPKGPLYRGAHAAAPLFRGLGERSSPRWLAELRWRVLHHAAYVEGYREGPPTTPPGTTTSPPGIGA